MCYTAGEFRVGGADVLLGEFWLVETLTVGATPVDVVLARDCRALGLLRRRDIQQALLTIL